MMGMCNGHLCLYKATVSATQEGHSAEEAR